MHHLRLNTQYIIFIALLLCGQAKADQFLVQNQHGMAVKNAVLEFSVARTPAHSRTVEANKNTLVMDQVNKLFKPEVLIIHKGDYVSFPNSDNIRHHVYSFSPVKPFELKLYSGKSKAPIQFDHSGVSVLGCNIHDSMVGYIYIADSPYTVLTDENGIATLAKDIEYQSLNIWHQNLSKAVTSTQRINYDDLIQKPDNEAIFVINLVLDSPEPRNTFQSIFKKNAK